MTDAKILSRTHLGILGILSIWIAFSVVELLPALALALFLMLNFSAVRYGEGRGGDTILTVWHLLTLAGASLGFWYMHAESNFISTLFFRMFGEFLIASAIIFSLISWFAMVLAQKPKRYHPKQ